MEYYSQSKMDSLAVSSIATLLGIEDLRPGRHVLRDEKRFRIGELHVSHAWYASIQPSFHDRAVVSVARALDTQFRGKLFPGFLRAGIAIVSIDTSELKQTVLADIEDDPLPSTVSSLNLFASDDSLWLDGIGYELHTDTRACSATIQFSNPREPCFQRIESTLFDIASRIAELSSEAIVIDYVAMWRSYIKESGRTP